MGGDGVSKWKDDMKWICYDCENHVLPREELFEYLKECFGEECIKWENTVPFRTDEFHTHPDTWVCPACECEVEVTA
tara:strand:- start:606 stop:836 length:231 start_codon:yes stop_codon:yes gene_type:complete